MSTFYIIEVENDINKEELQDLLLPHAISVIREHKRAGPKVLEKNIGLSKQEIRQKHNQKYYEKLKFLREMAKIDETADVKFRKKN